MGPNRFDAAERIFCVYDFVFIFRGSFDDCILPISYCLCFNGVCMHQGVTSRHKPLPRIDLVKPRWLEKTSKTIFPSDPFGHLILVPPQVAERSSYHIILRTYIALNNGQGLWHLP